MATYNDYIMAIQNTDSESLLNDIVEAASFNDNLTNSEYEEIYKLALNKARG